MRFNDSVNLFFEKISKNRKQFRNRTDNIDRHFNFLRDKHSQQSSQSSGKPKKRRRLCKTDGQIIKI